MYIRRFCQIWPRLGAKTSACRVSLQTRHYAQSRKELLTSIYGPNFSNLKKGSPEYVELSESGRVWENFFQPADIEPYLQAQSDLKHTLRSIDEFKEWFQKNDKARETISRALIPEYAQQSTSLELNPLHVGDAVVIFDELEKRLFCKIESPGLMSPSEVSKLALPTPEELLPGKNAHHVAELRNHILVSRYNTEVALRYPGTAGMSETDIRQNSTLLLRGTDAENLYAYN